MAANPVAPSPEIIALVETISQTLLADISSENPSKTCIDAPRRRHGSTDDPRRLQAQVIAEKMFPDLPPLSALIKYEREIVALRKRVLAQLEIQQQARREAKGRTERDRVRSQGPWIPPAKFYDEDYVEDTTTFSKKGAPALPVPVKISDEATLTPFFGYLKSNQAPTTKPNVTVAQPEPADSHSSDEDDNESADRIEYGAFHNSKHGHEPYYGVDMVEFEKGVVYTDNRMDLCKMVVGPQHIQSLMQSLEKNDHVKHFLLGNNIIGPTGAKAVAEFIQEYPNKIETWYLAANMIDASGLSQIVVAATESDVIHSVWLKRNPLGVQSAGVIAKLIKSCPKLRVLDVEQTELSDEGVLKIFQSLCEDVPTSQVALQTIYLNGTGVSDRACRAIADFLQHPNCKLENLYLSANPIGDKGAKSLAFGLKQNMSLRRLVLKSSGINSDGAIAIANSVSTHPNLLTLDLGQAFTTKDLNARYNYLTDSIVPTIATLLSSAPALRYLNLGITALTLQGLDSIRQNVASSHLFWFFAKSCFERGRNNHHMRRALQENVKREFGLDYVAFEAEELRWLRSPKDVRFIDSVYRNRDASLARRQLVVLKKQWDDGDQTMEEVMNFEA